jgi:hypothetical protein
MTVPGETGIFPEVVTLAVRVAAVPDEIGLEEIDRDMDVAALL